MKELPIVFFCILIYSQIFGQQQHIEPDMLEIPPKTMQYKMNKSKVNVRVSGFYISRFPESMKQYKLYLNELDSLGILDKNEHFPKEANLKKAGLNKEQIDFIRNEYFTKEDFNDYPIIGLDYNQIQLYLDWKTKKVGEQILNKLQVENPKSLSYLEFLKENNNVIEIPLQPEFLIPLEAQIISAFKELGITDQNSSIFKKNKSKDLYEVNQVLKRLKLKPIFAYDLSRKAIYKKLDELIVDTKMKGEKGSQVMELKNICSKDKNKYTLSTSANQMLKPWRVFNIKI